MSFSVGRARYEDSHTPNLAIKQAAAQSRFGLVRGPLDRLLPREGFFVNLHMADE